MKKRLKSEQTRLRRETKKLEEKEEKKLQKEEMIKSNKRCAWAEADECEIRI
jgi:hypothetical protein